MHPHAMMHAQRPHLRGANGGPDAVGAFAPGPWQHRMLPVVGKCDARYCSAIFLGVIAVPLACLCLCAAFCMRLRDGWSQSTGGRRTDYEHNAIAGLTGGGDAFREQLQRSREEHRFAFDEMISIADYEGEAAAVAALRGDNLERFGWKGTLGALLAGTRDAGSPLAALREHEATIVREIYSYVRNQCPPDTPLSGIYKAKYMDYKMRLRDGNVRLVFTREDRRYKIGGASQYESGETNIIEGYVLLDGREGWWREDFYSGAVGTELVNYGTFDFKRNCFVGKWRSSVGHSGSFIKFYS